MATQLTSSWAQIDATPAKVTALEATVNDGPDSNSKLRVDNTALSNAISDNASLISTNSSDITALEATVNDGANANNTLRTDLNTVDDAVVGHDTTLYGTNGNNGLVVLVGDHDVILGDDTSGLIHDTETNATNIADRVVKITRSYTAVASGDRTLAASPTITAIGDVLNQLIVDLQDSGVI